MISHNELSITISTLWSNAVVRSMNVAIPPLLSSKDFRMSSVNFKIASSVLAPDRKPNCIIIIIYHDFLPTPRRGSHVKSSKTHTQSSRYTP